MPVNKKARAFYFKIFEGAETAAANAIMRFQERRTLKKCVKHMPKLTSEQKKAVKEFWKPYCKVDTDWVRYYSHMTGYFDPRFIPNDLYYTKIDQHFNNRKLGYGFNDKNYYALIFPGIKQPKTVVRKIGGMLFDEEYRQIDCKKAMELLVERAEVIVKPSTENGGGRGIKFYDTKKDSDLLKQILLDKGVKNIIIQDIVKQHPELAKLHPQSLNTTRIYTLMLNDGVHILNNTAMRIGTKNHRIDNFCANAGIFVGVKENGDVTERAITDIHSDVTVDRCPGGMLFSEIKVPEFEKMNETVKKTAQHVGNFRLVGWDLAVDETGNVVLIEANMRKAGIEPQLVSGPFFGELTERVLDEVFGRK